MARRDDIGRIDDDPLWYKNAVIYELHVRAFRDSDGDGIGDFKGLTQKLDYLESLGVTALWLLPFYPSPLRDDGYDIADYTEVNRSYGRLKDFKAFVREAHKRGMRVITELVLNHTSDQHKWFQQARRAKAGTSRRDFYVWSDTDERYRDVRIIFKDFERSNWTWDHDAQAYFWHRFYSHQPDLNYDNPAVHREVFKVLDFWLGMGVDGLRLDAVPYLYQREGTNCENLAETHEFLKTLRKHVDDNFEGRMLLAEANQWPEDAAKYFGDGDECHMSFHFPLMPRLFMAIHMEDRFPVIDILQQTPSIPDSSQWAIFLRNHDELTLEMVTDEERDYMYRMYANDRRARINLGIRRRLAPLLGNNRRKIELMNGLLFSLPGTPVIYYGDEIGMGDNIYLGDRDAVRTPMQWSPDRNAGFSDANPQRLYLPVIIDPEYNFETVNVEAQQNNPHSLLWWMKRLISLRQRHSVFGSGEIEFLHPDNPKVLAYIRSDGDEAVLVVANLSRFVQCVELDLAAYRGQRPIEMFGHTPFPQIGDLPYFLTVGPHGFYWFSLQPAREGLEVEPGRPTLPVVNVPERWTEALSGRSRRSLERVLPEYMSQRRWFGGKARSIQAAHIVGSVPIPAEREEDDGRLTLVTVDYTEGEVETYVMPLAVMQGERADDAMKSDWQGCIGRVNVRGSQEPATLYDAAWAPGFWSGLLEAIARRRRFRDDGEEAICRCFAKKLQTTDDEGLPLRPSLSLQEQSNSAVFYGEKYMMKLFRRVSEGVNPDLEVGRFLTQRVRFPHTPNVVGALEWPGKRGEEPRTIAVLQEYVWNEGSAWAQALSALGSFYEYAATAPEPPLGPEEQLDLSGQAPPEEAYETIGSYLQSAELLGQRTAEMHRALGSDATDPAFAPEPMAAPHYQRSLYQSMRTLTRQTMRTLRRSLKSVPEEHQEEAQALLDGESDALEVFAAVKAAPFGGSRIRTHGDYHLGQVLHTGKDYVIIDFEGEPARPISERRLKRSPLRDVAGMIRSFHYAAFAALFQHIERWGVEADPDQIQRLHAFARRWRQWSSAGFLSAYFRTLEDSPLLPDDPEQSQALLRIYALEKAMYELGYELNNRPTWVRIPLAGVVEMISPAASTAT